MTTDNIHISDIKFHTEGPDCGYITAFVDNGRRAAEIEFRVFDPRCDKQLVLAWISGSLIDKTFSKHWASIEKRLRNFCIQNKNWLEQHLTFSFLTEPGYPLAYQSGTWQIEDAV